MREINFLLAVAIAAHVALAAAAQGGWVEELAVQAVGDGRQALAHLQFSASAPLAGRHAGAFPPAVLQLVQRHNIEHLAATLTRGRWSQHEPPPLWAPMPPPGMELTAAFAKGTNATKRELEALGQALSGLLAAAVPSLLEHGALAAPAVGWFGDHAVQRRQVYAAAPQEALCSENIDAWLRLLPCRGQAGLAALLQPAAFLSAPMHSLQLRIDAREPPAQAGGGCADQRSVELTLGATLIVDGDVRRAWEASSVGEVLKAVHGAAPPPACAAAAASTLHLAASHADGSRWPVQGCSGRAPGWQSCPVGTSDSSVSEAVVPAGGLVCAQPPASASWRLDTSSHVAAVSPQAGKLTIAAAVAFNATGATAAGGTGALLHLIQVVPWEAPLRWRTLQLTVNGQAVALNDAAVAWHVIRPAQIRGRGALLELLLRLPALEPSGAADSAAARVAVSVEFEKRLLTVHDYPPDASRGVDIPAAALRLVPPGCDPGSEALTATASAAPLLHGAACGCRPLLRRGRVHLVQLPIPDASMPFNVVCFTSTALALYFGALHNTLLRSPLDAAAAAAAGGGVGGGLGGALRQRAKRVVLVVLLVGGLGVYLDPELQRKAEAWLAAAGVGPFWRLQHTEL